MRLFLHFISRARRAWPLLLALTVAPLGSCKLFDSTCEADDRDCVTNPLFASGVGGACERDGDCRQYLYCIDARCKALGTTDTGEECRLTAECGDRDYCGSQRVCKLAGDREEGDDCETTGECKHGLVCEGPDLTQTGTLGLSELAQLSAGCTEGGTLEQGEECDRVSDCLAGLACFAIPGREEDGKICTNLSPSDFEIPALPEVWDGIECPAVAESDPPQSYFAVPRGDDPDPAEFYSLPFPNDVRVRDGRLDLAGHPVPPAEYNMPFLERYIEVAQEDLEGFSTNPVVLFRFSHAYDFESIDEPELHVRLVDITPASPDYDRDASLEWKTTSGDLSNYVCPHWLGLRRPIGEPLRPRTTYAAVITTGIKPCGTRQGGACTSDRDYERASDFEAMLESDEPGEPELADAWQAYAPLRAWIDDTGVEASSILNAAVFTTQDPEAVVAELRDAIDAEPSPSVSDLTVCASPDTDSPCAQGDRGRCRTPGDGFTEVHGRIRLPQFQEGTRPYEDPDDGGGFELDGDGAPRVQDRLDVCFALSVPDAPARAGGYPVLVYAHGTGGVFNGQMGGSGFAEVLAAASAPSVLVAIDMPQHGARRGDSEDEPEGLFYNFLNPRAARDNVLQGAADLMSVVRWIGEGGLMIDGDPVAFDTARIALMGHSQGATHAAVMAGYEPSAIGVVLSGSGGHLSTSMLTKTSPVDIASVVPIGLLDPDSEFELVTGNFNPALAILQSVFDRADPVNYARRMHLEPAGVAASGRHVFMTYGLGDTFSPEPTQAAYARAARLPIATPVLEDLRLPVSVAPVRENASVDGFLRTVGLRQYEPVDEVDGHFVGTAPGQPGRQDVERFLEQLLSESAPQIGP